LAVVALGATLDVSGVFAAPSPPAPVAARIDLNAHDEPVRDVLLRIGEKAHLNVTVADDVRRHPLRDRLHPTADDETPVVATGHEGLDDDGPAS